MKSSSSPLPSLSIVLPQDEEEEEGEEEEGESRGGVVGKLNRTMAFPPGLLFFIVKLQEMMILKY